MAEALAFVFVINVLVAILVLGYYVWKKSRDAKPIQNTTHDANSVTIAALTPPPTAVKRVLVIEGTTRPKGSVQWLKSWGVAADAITDVAKVDSITQKDALPANVRECFDDLYAVGSVRGIDATKFALGEKMDDGKALYFVLLEHNPKDLRLLALIA